MRTAIPNAITLTNLLFGCIGISLAAAGDLENAARCVYLAAILDFLDGFAARALKAQSVIGKDLDSLADLVSFGVLPAFLLVQFASLYPGPYWLQFGGFAIALASALRLARFNHDSRQTDGFIGLPTPANAILIASLIISLPHTGLIEYVNGSIIFWTALLLSWLLLSPIPMLAFKFKSFAWAPNRERYLFLIFSAIILLGFTYLGLAFVILSYVSWSLLRWLLSKRNS
ncbi:MAG: CDP-diacylglycerol--serine O-phosphatidyltransferase [Bacteroidia bacterium]